MNLVLGVVDVAYSGEDGSVTTTDVAGWLEKNYQVMAIFFEEYRDQIGEWLAEGIGHQIQDLIGGAPAAADPFFDAEQRIESAFRDFLAKGEIEAIHPDAPTQAALEGRSKRRMASTGPRRVSLVDTGTYSAAFRAWIEQ